MPEKIPQKEAPQRKYDAKAYDASLIAKEKANVKSQERKDFQVLKEFTDAATFLQNQERE